VLEAISVSALPDGDFAPISDIVVEFSTTQPTVARAIRLGHIRAIRHGARRYLVARASAREYFVRPAGVVGGLTPDDQAFIDRVVAAAPTLDAETRRQIADLLPAGGA
jgi:hypothetical protein